MNEHGNPKQFDTLIASLSTNFINCPLYSIDDCVNDALKTLGMFAGVDRSYVFKFSEDGARVTNAYEWNDEGIPRIATKMKNPPSDYFRWFVKKMGTADFVHVVSMDHLTPDDLFEQETFKAMNSKSVLHIPLRDHGVVIGFVGFDAVRAEKTWSEETINVLGIVAEMFASALDRKKTGTELWESVVKYHGIFDNAVVGIFSSTLDGKLLTANAALARMHGFNSPKEMLEAVTNIPEQLYSNPEDRQRFIHSIEDSHGMVADFEILFKRKEGSSYLGRMHSWTVVDSDGKVDHLEGFIEDVTELRESERAVRESESKYRAIFENSGAPTIIIEGDRTISLVNEEFIRLSGFDRQMVEGKTKWDDLIAPEDKERLLEYHRVRRIDATKVPEKYELHFIDHDGFKRDLIVSADMIPGTSKSVVSLVDVTERTKAVEEAKAARNLAEERARESEEGRRILEALMQHIPEGIAIADAPNVSVRMISKYGEDMGGGGEHFEQVLTGGSGDGKGQMFHADGITAASLDEQPLVRATKYGETITNEEWILQRSDGKRIMISVNAGPIRDKNGKIAGGIMGWSDITERKQAQEKLRVSHDRLEKSIDGIINAIVKIVETRDPYTAGHERRVAQLAYAISLEMGISEEKAKGIRMAGIIHDIGKIYVPAEILSKPGPLSEMEFAIIKIHPQASYDILKVIEFPWPIAQIALQHQERLNGSGYPLGISGDEILIEARILAVADVVEAMMFYRPYRSAIGIEKALEEIEHNRGVLYDANVVDTCLKLFREKKFAFTDETDINK